MTNGDISSDMLRISLPAAFTADEIFRVMQHVKAGTAPGYDFIHPEFLKTWVPKLKPGCLAFSPRSSL